VAETCHQPGKVIKHGKNTKPKIATFGSDAVDGVAFMTKAN
jgi:hypothetical protein